MALLIGVGFGAVIVVVLFTLMPVEFSGGIMGALRGKRTYIIASVGVAVHLGEYLGLLPAGTGVKVDGALLFLGLGTMRMAMANLKIGDAAAPTAKVRRPPVFDLSEPMPPPKAE